MKNIEKMAILTIVLLVYVAYATPSYVTIKVGTTGEGDASIHSIATVSDDDIANYVTGIGNVAIDRPIIVPTPISILNGNVPVFK